MFEEYKLIHYTDEPFDLEIMPFDLNLWGAKPKGLWFSVEQEAEIDGNYNWKQWCEAENFNLENLTVSYEITFKEAAKILHLKTEDEIIEFTKQYALKTRNWDTEFDTYEINWGKVKEKYQGIIIAPYQWYCRINLETMWYYGWDCSSGCVWDLSCIEKFELITKKEKNADGGNHDADFGECCSNHPPVSLE